MIADEVDARVIVLDPKDRGKVVTRQVEALVAL